MARAPIRFVEAPTVQRFAAPLGKAAAPARASVQMARPPMVQLWTALSNANWMHKNGRWQAAMAAGRVTKFEAKNLQIKGKGFAIGASKNPATATPVGWLALKKLGLTHPGHPPNYVRMHMLNGRLGGPGNTVDNLAPGSNKLNGLHYRKFEKTVINAVKAGSLIDTFTMTPTYNAGGGALKTAAGKTAWNKTVSKLVCVATHTPPAGLAAVPLANVTINETPNLDTKKNWLGL
uniref:Type VII secretion system protein EssD-like domain-containing protein n=1 Tax=Caulobacter sp. (strain K31) TaxID=366602 RepID=B0SYZ7_CAUSK